MKVKNFNILFRSSTMKPPLCLMAVILSLLGVLMPSNHLVADVEGSIDYINKEGLYVSYGDYRKEYRIIDEVEIMHFDRSMGFGVVEKLRQGYMVVRPIRLLPGTLLKEATRVRKSVPEKLATIRKVITPETLIYYDPEEVILEIHVPSEGKKVKKIKKTPEDYEKSSIDGKTEKQSVKKSRRRMKAEEKDSEAPPPEEDKLKLKDDTGKSLSEEKSSEKKSSKRRARRRMKVAPQQE